MSTPPASSWATATCKLAQQRDRIAELEAKVADYEDQIVRAFQRIRADDKTTEKTRRALAVALALLDERANAPAAPTPRQPITDDRPSSRPSGRGARRNGRSVARLLVAALLSLLAGCRVR